MTSRRFCCLSWRSALASSHTFPRICGNLSTLWQPERVRDLFRGIDQFGRPYDGTLVDSVDQPPRVRGGESLQLVCCRVSRRHDRADPRHSLISPSLRSRACTFVAVASATPQVVVISRADGTVAPSAKTPDSMSSRIRRAICRYGGSDRSSFGATLNPSR